MTNLNHQVLWSLIEEFELNPVVAWELSINSSFDNLIEVDPYTLIYKISIVQNVLITERYHFKILHLIRKNLILVMTDSDGEKEFM